MLLTHSTFDRTTVQKLDVNYGIHQDAGGQKTEAFNEEFQSLNRNTEDLFKYSNNGNIFNEEDINDRGVFSDAFSDDYQSYRQKAVLQRLSEELESWLEKGTDDSLSHIANIRILLSSNEQYFISRPESRILFGFFELIFENSVWEQLTTGQIKNLFSAVKQMEKGDLTNKSLMGLLKRIQSSGASLVFEKNEKETKKQSNT